MEIVVMITTLIIVELLIFILFVIRIKKVKESAIVEAKVVGKCDAGSYEGRKYYKYTYEYDYEFSKYCVECKKSDYSNYEIGDKATIYVDKREPEKIINNLAAKSNYLVAISSFVALVVTVLFLLIILNT